MASVYRIANDNEEKFIHFEKLNKNYKINNNFLVFLEFMESQEEAEESGKEIKTREIVNLVKKTLKKEEYDEIMEVATMEEVLSIFKAISAAYQNITPAQLKKQEESEEEESGK